MVHSEGPYLVLYMVVYTREIVGRVLSNILSVVDLTILEGIVLTLYNLALILVEEFRAQLVEEVGLLVWVKVQVEIQESVLVEGWCIYINTTFSACIDRESFSRAQGFYDNIAGGSVIT